LSCFQASRESQCDDLGNEPVLSNESSRGIVKLERGVGIVTLMMGEVEYSLVTFFALFLKVVVDIVVSDSERDLWVLLMSRICVIRKL
jgi:hypothetical protein